jgi:hypothetical protein
MLVMALMMMTHCVIQKEVIKKVKKAPLKRIIWLLLVKKMIVMMMMNK